MHEVFLHSLGRKRPPANVRTRPTPVTQFARKRALVCRGSGTPQLSSTGRDRPGATAGPAMTTPSVIDYLLRRRQPGSIPIFLIIGPASGAVRNFTSALAASGAGAAACRPAENTVMFWMSAGNGPR